MTGQRLVQLNCFMQSQSTVDWLRNLRSLYYWQCAKQLFLREIYQLTGIITRKRTGNMFGQGNIASIRTCDLQSPGIFWRAFEDIHQIQFDNESVIDDEQWHDDFQQYLIDKKLNNERVCVNNNIIRRKNNLFLLDSIMDGRYLRISINEKIECTSITRME
jgi:hypothetical protein